MYLNNINTVEPNGGLRGKLIWAAIVVGWYNATRNSMHRVPGTRPTKKQWAAIVGSFVFAAAFFVGGAVASFDTGWLDGFWYYLVGQLLIWRAVLAVKGGRAPYWNAPPKITSLAELRRQVF